MPGKSQIAAAVALALVLGGPTLAEDFEVTEWIELVNSIELGGGDSVGGEHMVPGDVPGVIGFEIRYEFINPTGDGSWASDLRVILEVPDGRTYSVGGQTHLPQSNEPWSFQGFISAPNGVYGDSGNDVFMPGDWQDDPPGGGPYALTFVNDWDGDFFPNTYNGISVRFYMPIPTGACCLADGSCLEDLEEAQCLDRLDAVSWHEGLTCEEAACEPTIGACCLLDGTCLEWITLVACVANPDHVSWNGGLTCAEAACEPLIGACCLMDGTCLEWTSEEQCLGNPDHVSWNGGLTCAEAACEPIIGACCLADGTCIEWISEEACLDNPDHVSWNGGQTCAEAACEPIIGACCLADGSCLEWISEDACLGNPDHVSWNGGLTCAEAACEPIIGACCLADGTCLEWISEEACLGNPDHVSWNGGLTCAEAACEPIIGACCLADGTCLEWISEDACLGNPDHVSWNGGLTCAAAACEPIIGACCLADGSCLEWISEEACLDNPDHVSWNGGLTCADAACEPIIGACCLADGTCLEWISEDACLGNPDHVSWNGGLTCVEAACEPIIGACCLADGTCLEWISEDACLGNPDHVSWNGGQTCAEAACEPIIGACCLADGSCIEWISEDACLGNPEHVSWNGGQTCAEAACDATVGACCLTDGSCIEWISEDACLGNPEHVSWNGGQTCAEAACDATVGACCLTDGSCIEWISEDACLGNPDHVSWNGGLTCAEAACEPTIGACCLADGTCLEWISEDACLGNPDHVSWNGGQTCAEAACEPIIGACCLADGSCIEWISEDACLGNPEHVSWNGGQTCAEAACDATVGACCLTDGSCIEWISEDACLGNPDHVSWNGGQTCAEAACEPTIGACCLADGTCLEWISEDACLGNPDHVSWNGGLTCVEASCEATVGACCLEDGSCLESVSEVACMGQAGSVSWNRGLTCAEAACEVLIGACCLADGSCLESVSEAVCLGQPDYVTWYRGLDCLEAACEAIIGACCLTDGSCLEWLEEDECLAQAGSESWHGGLTCAEADCQPVLGACCFPVLEPSDCCVDGKPRVLTLQYTGNDCSATSHTQDPGKVECDDYAPLTDLVYIVANDGDDPESGRIWFQGDVALGETFDLDAANGGEDHLKSSSHLHVFDHEGGTLLQRVEFHTSCSQPLFVGDQFGSGLVVGCIGEDAPFTSPAGAGDCEDLLETDCVAAGGVYQGDDTICAETLCFIGACCLPPSSADCCENGRPRLLTMRYTGDDCSATSHTQDPDKVECHDVAPLTPVVYIIANDDQNPASTPVWFAGAVALDGTFALDAEAGGENGLKSTSWLHVYDEEGGTLLQRVKFHTSCSQPLFVGDQFGSAAVVGCIGQDDSAFAGEPALCEDLTEGECDARGGVFQGEGVYCADDPCPFGACCLPPGGSDCCEGGKPRILTMRYTGDDCSATHHDQDPGKVECVDLAPLVPVVYIIANDDANPASTPIWFEGNVALDETFDLDAQAGGESHLKSTSWLHVFDGKGGPLLQRVKFHTSCSQPLFVGDQFGSAVVVGCVSENAALAASGGSGLAAGGDLACVDTSEPGCLALGGVFQGDGTTCAEMPCPFGACCLPPPSADCCEHGKPRVLTLEYTGDDCSATTHGQDPSKVECSDFAPLTGTVYIIANDDADPGSTPIWFDGVVALGATFDLDAQAGGESHLKSTSWLHVYDAKGGTLLQRVKFHTSCSQPLFIGDQFGCAAVAGCIGEDQVLGAASQIDGPDACEEISEVECVARGGVFQGDGTTCADVNCGDDDQTAGPVPADANGDGRVDFQDLLRVLAAWGACDRCPEDLDGDGHVDFADLLRVLENLE